jgi:O-antigen/teichoic acid export membrane protein
MSLTRNSIWNLAGAGLPFLLGAVTIPYLIKHIGVEAFGILTLIWAFIGYFSIFDFGLGRALTQQVASSLASEEEDNVPQLVKSGILFTCIAGLVGGGILAILAFPLGTSWLKVSSPALQSETVYCLLIASLGVPMTTVTTGIRGVLEAYQDFRAVNLLRILLGIANFGLPALSVMTFGSSLALIVVSLILSRFVILIAHAMLLNRKLPRWLSGPIRSENIKKLVSFGAWMTVSNIVSPLMVTADRFVISSVLGAGAVAYYTVPFEFLIRILVLPAAITGALFPQLAATYKLDAKRAEAIYRQSLKFVFLVMLALTLIICLGSYQGLSLWLGKEFAEKSWVIVSILSVGILFNGVAQVPFVAVQATGNAKVTAYLHLIEAAVYIPLLFGLIYYFGLIGAAIAWTGRVVLDLLLLLFFKRLYNK